MHTIFRYPVQTASIAPGGARRSPTMAGAVATLQRTKKRPGIPPGRRGCRSAAHTKQNAPHRPDRTAIEITDPEHGKPPPVDSSREDWTDDIRSVTVLQSQEFPFSLSNGTLPLISGFVPGYPSKSAIDREKTLVLRTKVVFW